MTLLDCPKSLEHEMEKEKEAKQAQKKKQASELQHGGASNGSLPSSGVHLRRQYFINWSNVRIQARNQLHWS